MNFNDFFEKRKKDKEWKVVNGYSEGDPNKNGEFKTLVALRNGYDVFVDVGANNGFFIDEANGALLENKLQAPPFVIAFEPNPKLQECLMRKIVRGVLVQSALSNKKGNSFLNLYAGDDTVSSLFDRSDLMPHFTNDVIKIETEGKFSIS